MKLSTEKPPNFEEIHNKLGVNWEDGIVFSYGDTIYSNHTELLPDVIFHEMVHQRQQSVSPDVWWTMYLMDKDFRLSQEKEAYIEQAKFLKRAIKDKNTLYRCLIEVAKDFSHKAYGPIISYEDAIKLLT